eukprot:11424965-Heterocapsa_arctica.AAC.1
MKFRKPTVQCPGRVPGLYGNRRAPGALDLRSRLDARLPRGLDPWARPPPQAQAAATAQFAAPAEADQVTARWGSLDRRDGFVYLAVTGNW